MNVASKLLAFAVLLWVAFGAAALAGAQLGPTSQPARARSCGSAGGGAGSAHQGMAMPGMASMHAGAGGAASGLAVSDGSYTLHPEVTTPHPGVLARFAFRLIAGHGAVVRTDYQLDSRRLLHLIVVRRDLRDYHHLHPTRDASGTWSTPLTLTEPRVYRVYADFQVACQRHVLAADLYVPGEFAPQPLPAPARSAQADGYQVALQSASGSGGAENQLSFRVSRDGRPVTGLEPYLGARGHLVALRQGDLAYLHVHPMDIHAQAGQIVFHAVFPSPGAYRLFLQFQTAGQVHTAAHTLEVSR
ncbi:MAG: hypothetical protein ACR2QA_16585 [Solirubrobacteraceae bacterium]